MMWKPQAMAARAAVLAAVAALVLPELALAQGGAGFLFKRPSLSIGFKTGYTMPNAGSDLFDFAREQLTLNKSDFNSAYYGGEFAVRTSERLDIVLGLGFARSETPSEFRDWVGTDDLPIEQRTAFWTAPLTLSARYYVSDRGRSIGRFAWVPRRVSPFVGAGIGMTWYEFEQTGDFVDFETLDIFFDRFSSDGVTGQAHGFAGVDVSVNKNFVLTAEGRYNWARGALSREFVDFDKMDLAGAQFTVGISARF